MTQTILLARVPPGLMSDPGEHFQLVAAVRAGSAAALGELYARHADAVYTTAYRITASPQEAEDILQDVFVGLARALRPYQEQGRFEAWLKRLTARAALMHLRTRRRKGEETLDVLLHDSPGATHDLTAPVMLERLIVRLPDSLRVVFVLREVEGYSHAEIAGLLAISATNSAARLSRAWTLLRKEALR
jgi:RNA polymerase sigma factor (sigma-70 family)